MKKLNKSKIATFLAAFTLTATTFIRLPDSFFLLGEPTLPLDELEN